MTYLVTQLSTNDQQELIQAFKRFDKNSNGTISKEEMFEGYKELYSERKLTDEQIQAEVDMIWDKIDMDGSGAIDYTEWTVGTINKANVITKAKLKKAFDMFDIDGSGKISAQELKAVLGEMQMGRGGSLQSSLNATTVSESPNTNVDDQIWVKMIQEADIDGDGEISLEEFERLMTALLANQRRRSSTFTPRTSERL